MKAILLAALLCACAQTDDDPATDQEDYAVTIAQPVHLENNYTGKCIDIENGTINTAGAHVNQYHCHQGTNQTFDVTPAAAVGGGTVPGMYWLRVHDTNMCVTPQNNSNGVAPLVLSPCSAYAPDGFVFSTYNAAPGTYYLENQYYSSCVDVPGAWTNDGLQLQIFPCHQLTQVNNQQWILYN